MYKEEKELWVKFACAAIAGGATTIDERTDSSNDGSQICIEPEDLITIDCEYAAVYADEMLEQYKEKFKDC